MQDQKKWGDKTRDKKKIRRRDKGQKNGETRCEMKKKWGDARRKKMERQDVSKKKMGR